MVYRPISNQTHPINRIIVFRLPLSSKGSLKWDVYKSHSLSTLGA